MAQVVLAGLAAGAVAIGATVAVERLGGRLGGLIGTLPTTIVPAAAGIWSSTAAGLSEPEAATAFASAMAAVPVGMWVNVLFLQTWREAPRWIPGGALPLRLAATTVSSLGVWATVAGAAVWGMDQLRTGGVWMPGLGGLALVLSLATGLWATRVPLPAPKGTRAVGPFTRAARGLLAALAIAGAVALAGVAGPLVSGMASVFPAIFLTSMVSLWWSQGEAVQGGAVAPMMLGASSVSAYALWATFTLPALGMGVGSAVAWVLAVGAVTLPAFFWMQWRARVAAATR